MSRPKIQKFRPIKSAFGFNSLVGTVASIGGVLTIIIFTVLGALEKIDVPSMLAALLGSVGFVACSLLLERLLLFNKIDHDIAQLTSSIGERGGPGVVKYGETSRPEEFLVGARDVLVYGLNKVGFFGPRREMFTKLLESGCKIRVVIADAETPNLLDCIARNLVVDPAMLRADYDRSVVALRDIWGRTLPEGQARLSVRLWPAPPLMGAIIVDAATVDARMILYFYTYAKDPADRPALEFRRSANPQWFDHMKESFELVWGEAVKSRNPIGATIGGV